MSFTRITGPGISSYPVISGIITALNFKTGTSNLHNVGLEAAGINVLGGDTPIGTGATIFKDGSVRFGHTGNNNTGIVTANKVVATTVTATTFSGDGSNLTSLPAGLGTALSSTQTSPLNKLYYTDNVLSIGATITVNPPPSASAAYTQYTDIVVEDTADLIMGDGDDLVPDVLGLSTETATVYSATGGRIRAGTFTNAGANGAPTATNGWIVTGVSTVQTLSVTGNATISGNLGVAGTITYEDVARVDATGISTFREGFGVGPLAGIALTAYKDGSIRTTGIITASSFGSDTNSIFTTGGTERLRITSAGRIGINNNNPDRTLNLISAQGGNCDIELKTSNNTGWSQVVFSDTDANYRGAVGYSHTNDFMSLYTANTERVRIDSSGRIKIGTTSTAATNEAVTIKGDSAGDCFVSLRSIQHADGNDQRIRFMVGDAIGSSGNITSSLSSEIVQTSSGTLKANLVISANRGDALTNRYIIYGDSSVDHEFKTKTAASLLKLHNSGLVEIADGDLKVASGHGIDFGATAGPGNSASSSSEILSDYEEGSWTPTVHDGTISNQFAHYRKIGKQVTVWAMINNFSDRSTNDLVRVKNLPYQPISSTDFLGGSMLGSYCSGSLISAAYVWSGGQIQFYGTGSGSYEQLRHNELNNSNAQIYFFCTYAVG